jgi:hypothetical protein
MFSRRFNLRNASGARRKKKRSRSQWPKPLPMPPITRLVAAGVGIFAGSGNIHDASSPCRNGDRLEGAMRVGYDIADRSVWFSPGHRALDCW